MVGPHRPAAAAQGHGARAAGRRGVRRARVTGAAAAHRHRRARRPRAPAPAPLHPGPRRLRPGHAGAGGPAGGEPRRLPPRPAPLGVYDEDRRGGGAPPPAGLVDEFPHYDDGYGSLLEGAQYTTAIGPSAVPFPTAAAHKEALSSYRH